MSDERSLHLRTAFLRRVAHDIASPTGVTMTVLDELAADAKRPELVVMAKRGLKRLLRLSEQLALAADLEAGSTLPDTIPDDVRRLVKEAVDTATAIDGRRGINVTCDVPQTRLMAEVDRRLMLQVLREMIGNALRLASSQVAVLVSAPAAADDASAEARVEIRISDDGPGFPEDTLAALGERFTPRASKRGLGLSVSMAMEVVEAHGGELRIEESTLPPGRRGSRGAAVVISLPLVV